MSFPIETFYALEKVGKQKNSVFEFIPGLNLKSLKKQILKPFWTRTRQDSKMQLVDLIILLSARQIYRSYFLPGLKRKSYSDKKTLLLIPMSTNID